MKKRLGKWLKPEFIFLFFILIFSAFLRLYRLDQLLGFWYDQGRDALVIWDLLHRGKFFLIGPVTGIEGIFLGPFFYYFLAPFYLLGKGSPVFVTACLGWLSVGTIFLIYFLTRKIYGPKTALLAAFIYGFSYNFVQFSRWLANPNPLPFFTLLAILCLYKFIESHNSKFIILGSFLIGLCLQLEAAAATFFLPTMVVFLFWQRKKVKSFWVLILSLLAFFLTLLPQIYFNFRHDGILLTAFEKFLVKDKSFGSEPFISGLGWLNMLKLRLLLYYDVFFGRLFPGVRSFGLTALALFSATFFITRKKIFSLGGKFLVLWLVVPLIGYCFYRGNNGYIWDYYFAGIFPAFIILFSASLVFFFEKRLMGRILFGSVLMMFLASNFNYLRGFYKAGIGITLGSELKGIDWIYNDAGSGDFNVDVYVPPQIFYSYTYLFRWYGKEKYKKEPQIKLVKNLYTLSEPDPEHPQFLDAWLKRQDGIGKIVKGYSWGDITIQKRERIKYE